MNGKNENRIEEIFKGICKERELLTGGYLSTVEYQEIGEKAELHEKKERVFGHSLPFLEYSTNKSQKNHKSNYKQIKGGY